MGFKLGVRAVLSQCSGAPAQQFDFLDGVLYNEVTDLCVAAKPLCMVDYTVTLSNTSAADRCACSRPFESSSALCHPEHP